MRHAGMILVIAVVSLVMTDPVGLRAHSDLYSRLENRAAPRMIIWSECAWLGSGSARFSAPAAAAAASAAARPLRFEQNPAASGDVCGTACEDEDVGGDDEDGNVAVAEPRSDCEPVDPELDGFA